MQLESFLSKHPVFSFDEAVATLAQGRNRRAMVDRLKHHVKSGKLRQVTRGIYAVVTPSISSGKFRPDPFQVGLALRPDAVFSHHSALELLGASHTIWNAVTLYSAHRRKTLTSGGIKYTVFLHPTGMVEQNGIPTGTRNVERGGRLLTVTGPERTLVEGFRRPSLVGGLEELVNSAGGFSVLDLSLLQKILEHYDTARLWAAVGWFLERLQHQFDVPPAALGVYEQRGPSGPQYLDRKTRGGKFIRRWNLMLPDSLANSSDPHGP